MHLNITKTAVYRRVWDFTVATKLVFSYTLLLYTTQLVYINLCLRFFTAIIIVYNSYLLNRIILFLFLFRLSLYYIIALLLIIVAIWPLLFFRQYQYAFSAFGCKYIFVYNNPPIWVCSARAMPSRQKRIFVIITFRCRKTHSVRERQLSLAFHSYTIYI